MSIYVVLLVVLLNMSAFRGSKVLVSLFALELGAPQIMLGVIVALYSLCPMLLALYAGKLADRFMVMEHGQVIQQFTQDELPSRMARLHEYLGV